MTIVRTPTVRVYVRENGGKGASIPPRATRTWQLVIGCGTRRMETEGAKTRNSGSLEPVSLDTEPFDL